MALLRYGWQPSKLPATCACGEVFDVVHALHCPKGGYTHIRHNDIRDSLANLMNEVCNDVELEPILQPLHGETFANKSTNKSTLKPMDFGNRALPRLSST